MGEATRDYSKPSVEMMSKNTRSSPVQAMRPSIITWATEPCMYSRIAPVCVMTEGEGRGDAY